MDQEVLYAAYGIVHGALSNRADGAVYRITLTDTRLIISIRIQWDVEVAPFQQAAAEAVTSASHSLGGYIPFTIIKWLADSKPLTLYTSP